MKNKQIKYENLEKWEKTLASCIRCGYCFEHCPISKYTKWESDTPRAKIVMAHGLLAGELEPSDYIAEKMFSCFFCKRCEAACSSGVSLIDIFLECFSIGKIELCNDVGLFFRKFDVPSG